MKQIICNKCIRSSKEIAHKIHTSERITFKKGKARYAMYCDLCASLIEEKEVCYAKTVTLPHKQKENWEKEYIIYKQKGGEI